MENKQLSFFDTENKYERLTKLGDPLERLNEIIDWEMFREKLTSVCQNPEIISLRPPTLTEPDRNAVRSCRRCETQKQLRILTRRAIYCSISLRTRQGQVTFGDGCIMPPVQNLKTALFSGITKHSLKLKECCMSCCISHTVNQTNNSPKSLSRLEISHMTRNAFG